MNDRLSSSIAMTLIAVLTAGCGDDDAGPASSASAGTEAGPGMSDGSNASATEASSDTELGSTSTPSDESESGGTVGTTQGAETDHDSTTVGDDTDDSTGEPGDTADPTGPEELCEAPGNLLSCDADTTDPFQAIGLNCPGGPDEMIPIFNTLFESPNSNAWRVARQYGTYIDPNTNQPIWSPKEGEQFLMISTGVIAQPDANGVVTMTSPNSTNNGNPSFVPMPAPMNPARGSNNGAGGTPFVGCDGIGDCSDSIQAQWTQGGGQARDLLWFQFELEVPGGTHGFNFDFAYFSREFPTFIGGTFNDMFVVWSSSEAYTGNLCFVNDKPCTVTGLGGTSQNPQQTYKSNAPELAGTGFEPNGATGWYQAKAAAAPGETLQLTWAVFDMGDAIYDTLVIIDNFRWDCEGCVPSEVNPCGIEPIPT
jgi:hypothetical protein